jgi:hypothetical protein
MTLAFYVDHVHSAAEARAAASRAAAWRRSMAPKPAAPAALPVPAKPAKPAAPPPRPPQRQAFGAGVPCRVIVHAAADHFGVSVEMLRTRSRVEPLVSARHVAAYLIRTMRGCSLNRTAEILGWQDHTSCLHAIRRCESTPALLDAANAIRAALTAPATPSDQEDAADGL